MAEYRIDDLARAAGITVRNVQIYQDRGLLPPPERRGRVGIYSDAHLARLCLIGQLLERGYTFAGIAELIAAWQPDRDPGQVGDLKQELAGPWSEELPAYLAMGEILKMFDYQATPDLIQRAIELGLGEPEGSRFRIRSPRLLCAGAELVALGMPLDVGLELFDKLQSHVEQVAPLMVQTIAEHVVFAGRAPGWVPSGPEIAQLVALIQRLRPLVETAIGVLLAPVLERQVQAMIGERLAHALSAPSAETSSTNMT
jgi:DNA-binding transcriptional MerR regulator